MLIVKIPFVGHGYNMPAPRSLIDPPEPLRSHLLSIGVCERYETKVDPVPEVKKNEPSESLPADPVATKPTRRRSRKSATK